MSAEIDSREPGLHECNRMLHLNFAQRCFSLGKFRPLILAVALVGLTSGGLGAQKAYQPELSALQSPPAGCPVAITAVQGPNGYPLYQLTSVETDKVLGTVWDVETGRSDYGVNGGTALQVRWAPSGDYVAIAGGADNAPEVFLLAVEEKSLRPLLMPELAPEVLAPVTAIRDASAGGTELVGWRPDGTLVVKYWRAEKAESDNETPRVGEVWVALQGYGNEVNVTGVSESEMTLDQTSDRGPMGTAAAPDPFSGTHRVAGTNPDGKPYDGTVEVTDANGLFGLTRRIGKSVSTGNGVISGSTLGVVLENGVAVYRHYGQSEGESWIGRWTSRPEGAVHREAILVENGEMTDANEPAEPWNGRYVWRGEKDGEPIEGTAVISGGENVKTVQWSESGQSIKCLAVAFGPSLAIQTPAGLAVFERALGADGSLLIAGKTVSRNGAISPSTLIPGE